MNFAQVNLRDDRSARARGERVLAQVAPGARLIGAWDTVPVIEYLQLVEGRRPDVEAINRFLIPQAALVTLLRAEVGRRPVYLDAVPADLSTAYRVRRAGLLYEILPGRPPPRDLSTPSSATTPATTATASTAAAKTRAAGSKATPQAGHARPDSPQGVVR